MNKRRLFEEYIKENIDNAYRFALVFTRNRFDAEDVVSESVIKALKSVDKIRNVSKIKPWFYRIIKNTAIDNLNKRSAAESKIISADFSENENAVSADDDYSEMNVKSIINSLNEKYRAIVVLRFCENMTLKEIAKTLEISENTVKTRLYAALRKLGEEKEDIL